MQIRQKNIILTSIESVSFFCLFCSFIMAFSALWYYIQQIIKHAPHLEWQEKNISLFLQQELQEQSSLVINDEFIIKLEQAIIPTVPTPKVVQTYTNGQIESSEKHWDQKKQNDQHNNWKTTWETSWWSRKYSLILIFAMIVLWVVWFSFVRDSSLYDEINTQTLLTTPTTPQQTTWSFQEVPKVEEITLPQKENTATWSGEIVSLPPLFVSQEEQQWCIVSYQWERRIPTQETKIVIVDESNKVIRIQSVSAEQDIDVILWEVSKRVRCDNDSPVRLDTPNISLRYREIENTENTEFLQKEIFEVYEFEVNGQIVVWETAG